MKKILIFTLMICLMSSSLTFVKASNEITNPNSLTQSDDETISNEISVSKEDLNTLLSYNIVKGNDKDAYSFSLSYDTKVTESISVKLSTQDSFSSYPVVLDGEGKATFILKHADITVDKSKLVKAEMIILFTTGDKKTYDISTPLLTNDKVDSDNQNNDNNDINKKDENAEIDNDNDAEKEVRSDIEDEQIDKPITSQNSPTSHKPTIRNVRVENITHSSYTIKATVEDECGIFKVQVPTWTLKNGQDDIVWGEAVVIENEITYTVQMKDHAYEDGIYVSNLYVYDNSGSYSATDVALQNLYKTGPEIKDVKVISLSSGSYKITAKVSDDKGIEKVMFPTWTLKDGQDDIIWGKGDITGDVVTYIVDIKDHNFQKGDYLTNIYAYNVDGMYTAIDVPIQSLYNQKPSIKNVSAVKLDSGRYKVSAEVSDDYGIDYVTFPTWTIRNGQDDITWGRGTLIGNTVSYIVDMEEHNFESGDYLTNIYVYDKLGSYSAIAVPIQKLDNNEKPKISNLEIIDISAGKYTVKATVTDDYKISKVLFPTWTIRSGQDDIVWGEGIKNGDTYTFTVDYKNHDYEIGAYLTNVYAYDAEGKYEAVAPPVQTISKSKPEIKNAKVIDISAGYYTIEAEVYDDYGLDKVLFPTWTTENGQDDITWGEGVVEGSKVTYRVWIDYHNYEVGNYKTEIYAYNKAGECSTFSLPIQKIINEKPRIGAVTITKRHAGGYTVNVPVTDDYKISKVLFPTWTIKNGQDDLVWGEGRYANGVYSYDVLIDSHNYELGPYLSNIFAYDVTGEYTAISINTENVLNKAPTISDYYVSNVDSSGYTVTATITDDYSLDKVVVPTWTIRNGQDDIVWGSANAIGNNKFSYRVNVSQHGFESGSYLSNIYAYDTSGNYFSVSLPTVELDVKLTPGWQIKDGKKYLFNKDGHLVNGATKSVIDVSEHNGNIEWEKVVNSGIDYVILRVGYGWADDLNAQIDKKFIENARELERLGIPYGVYLFSYANDVTGAKKEADYTLRLLKGRKISLPVFYDLEYSSYAGEISSSTYVAMANAYCNIIQNAGYTPGIYANLNYWNTKLNDPTLDKYQKWVAQYNVNDGSVGHCDYDKNYKMWQYTSVGTVPGIKGSVDMNAWY